MTELADGPSPRPSTSCPWQLRQAEEEVVRGCERGRLSGIQPLLTAREWALSVGMVRHICSCWIAAPSL